MFVIQRKGIVKYILPYLALIVITIISLLPGRKEVSSYCLNTVTTEEGDTVRTDYVDENGHITFASNSGYATLVRTYEDGKPVLEEYFDEKGAPVAIWNNAAAVSYVYNDKGQAEWINYLDTSGKPAVTIYGYTSIHRDYTEDGLAQTDTYFNGKDQVENSYGYYSYKRDIFDEKSRPAELYYLDREGRPTDQKDGYAIIQREYYPDTWDVKKEFYFDKDGKPTTGTIGQYGFYREYNDKQAPTLTTYLDADGNPMNTLPGYTTVKTVYENESVKEFYFDKDGSPVSIGWNQYGKEEKNGQEYLLDLNGNRLFRIDSFMNNNGLFVMLTGIAMTILAIIINGRPRAILFAASIGIIIMMTLLFRKTGSVYQDIQIFDAFQKILTSPGIIRDIINNIWLFVPLGAVLFKKGSKRWAIPILVSILVEIVQLVTGRGTFEVADIICNSLGGLIGYLCVCGFCDKTTGVS